MCDDIPFCVCLQIGCSTKLSPEGDGTQRICPRCNNASVAQTKSTKCLEICCVPLVPLGSDHLWFCNICQWQADASGPAPPIAMQGYQHPGQFQGYAPQQQMFPPGEHPQQQQMYATQQQQQPYQPGYGGGGYRQ